MYRDGLDGVIQNLVVIFDHSHRRTMNMRLPSKRLDGSIGSDVSILQAARRVKASESESARRKGRALPSVLLGLHLLWAEPLTTFNLTC